VSGHGDSKPGIAKATKHNLPEYPGKYQDVPCQTGPYYFNSDVAIFVISLNFKAIFEIFLFIYYGFEKRDFSKNTPR
jgi:hypothetical protein